MGGAARTAAMEGELGAAGGCGGELVSGDSDEEGGGGLRAGGCKLVVERGGHGELVSWRCSRDGRVAAAVKGAGE